MRRDVGVGFCYRSEPHDLFSVSRSLWGRRRARIRVLFGGGGESVDMWGLGLSSRRFRTGEAGLISFAPLVPPLFLLFLMCYLDPVIYLSSFLVVVVVSPLLVFSGFLDLFLKFLLHIGLALGNSGGGGHSRYCFSSVKLRLIFWQKASIFVCILLVLVLE